MHDAEAALQFAANPYTMVAPKLLDKRLVGLELLRRTRETVATVKTCATCTFFVGDGRDKCHHPVASPLSMNIVSGELERVVSPYAEKVREKSGLCGPDAEMWTPKGDKKSERDEANISLSRTVWNSLKRDATTFSQLVFGISFWAIVGYYFFRWWG